ncbi:MAG: PrsW family intramembrane metalloprotease [Woeseiaceae bacterium]|nr:PrsW family intramembrane metalloprotease [Woeseiaceae bacterium]
MSPDFLFLTPIGLLPVLLFLFVLRYLDSYKLVSLRTVGSVIIAGCSLPIAAYFLNGWLMGSFDITFEVATRYVAPVTEELLKAIVVIYLFRSHKIGFLVDSAILGFAVGAGFALVENIYYLYLSINLNTGVWIVRGFGTAVMHGGVTAIFAILVQTFSERSMKINFAQVLPGFAAAVLIHSLYNQFVLPPILNTLTILVSLPPLLYFVFRRSAQHMHEWLEVDFDEDAEFIQQITSGEVTETKVGRFLHDLRSRFDGPVVVDMLCYLRIYTELALRAKGVLMMRENGLDVEIGERTREKFTELEYLEGSIGTTGLLAMRPFLHISRKDLWQMYVLDK